MTRKLYAVHKDADFPEFVVSDGFRYSKVLTVFDIDVIRQNKLNISAIDAIDITESEDKYDERFEITATEAMAVFKRASEKAEKMLKHLQRTKTC